MKANPYFEGGILGRWKVYTIPRWEKVSLTGMGAGRERKRITV